MHRRYIILCLSVLSILTSCKSPKPEVIPTVEENEVSETLTKTRIKTCCGDVVIELNLEKAPITSKNFIKYVTAKHYDGTVFHRVIDNFMIQGGGFALTDGKLIEKQTGDGIRNESQNGLLNDMGTIAMARTSDPDSATAQFFINVAKNSALNYPNNGGYAVFGRVVEGMDVVEKIKASKTTTKELQMRHPTNGQIISSPSTDVPVETVIIERVMME